MILQKGNYIFHKVYKEEKCLLIMSGGCLCREQQAQETGEHAGPTLLVIILTKYINNNKKVSIHYKTWGYFGCHNNKVLNNNLKKVSTGIHY